MMSHNSHLFLPYNALFLTFNCMVKVVNLWVRVSKGWSWWLGCCVILIVPFLGIERFWGLGSFCLNWSLLSRVVSPILRVCRWCALLILGAWKENACEAVAILFKFSGHFGEWIFYDFLPPYSCQIEFHWDHLNRHCHGPYLFFLVVLQCGQVLCSLISADHQPASSISIWVRNPVSVQFLLDVNTIMITKSYVCLARILGSKIISISPIPLPGFFFRLY